LYTFKFEPGEIFKVTGKSHYYHKTTNLLGESKEATAYQINNSCELYENAKFSIQIDKLNASSISDQCEIKKISKHTNNKRSAIWRVRKNFCLREQLQGRSLNHEDFFKVVELRASEGIYLCRLCDQSLIGLNESQMKSCEVFTT
jgi:hypothetical protein